MIPYHVYYQLAILGYLWLCVTLYYGWPSQSTGSHQKSAKPVPLKCKRKRSTAPKAFEGLTQNPPCAACEREATHHKVSPPLRPDPMPPTNRRPRVIDTSIRGRSRRQRPGYARAQARNKPAAPTCCRQLRKGWTDVSRVIITGKLQSFGAAKRESRLGVAQRQHHSLNTRAEPSPGRALPAPHPPAGAADAGVALIGARPPRPRGLWP